MRVVSVDHCARMSGAEVALARVAPYLEARDIELSVVVAEAGDLVAALAPARVIILPGSTAVTGGTPGGRRTINRGVSVLAYAVRLAQVIRRLRADVVHLNTMRSAVYGSLAARMAGRPAVWHMRDIIPAGQSGRRVRWLMANFPSAIIANSAFTARSAADSAEPVVIYDGVEMPIRQVEPYTSGPLRVVMAGRLAHWKGQDIALEAVRLLRRRVPASISFAGSAMFSQDVAFAEELRAHGADGVREGWVKFLGFQPRLDDIYPGNHVAVHCSRRPEPFGQVVVEAMSYGLPVVASDAGGPVDVLQDDLKVLLTPPNPESVAEGLLRLTAPDRWAVMATKVRARATSFSIDLTADRMTAVFREVRK